MESCYHCRSRDSVAAQIVRHFSPTGTASLYMENLPVKQCRVCGAIVFPVSSRAALRRGRAGELSPAAYRSVPVFDLQNPQARPEPAKSAAARPSIPDRRPAEIPGD